MADDVSSRTNRGNARIWVMTSVITCVLSVAGTLVAAYIARPDAPATGSPTPAARSTTTVPGAELRFASRPTKAGLHCGIYAGVGEIPSGYSLMVFDRTVDPDGNDVGAAYGYFGLATPQPGGGWISPPMDHGDPHVEVMAVLVPGAFLDFLSHLVLVKRDNGARLDGDFQFGVLPPGTVVPRILVDPDMSSASCPT